MEQQPVEPVVHSPVNQEAELRFWRDQILRYLHIKRLSVGLTPEEQWIFQGLQATVDQLTGL